MTYRSYIEFNDGLKFDVENFKLLSTKGIDEQFFDENGKSFNLHVPDQLKVKFEIDLKKQKHDEVLSLLTTGINFTAVNYEEEDRETGTGYSNCQAFLINEDSASEKVYVVCNWPYTENNLINI